MDLTNDELQVTLEKNVILQVIHFEKGDLVMSVDHDAFLKKKKKKTMCLTHACQIFEICVSIPLFIYIVYLF